MIVFGGLHGIEAAIEADEKLRINKLEQVFDFVCESKNEDECNFGSRTVRLEVNKKWKQEILKYCLRNKLIEACKNDDELNNTSNNCIQSSECKIQKTKIYWINLSYI